MAVNDDITLSKGDISVTLFTSRAVENYKNLLTTVPGVVSPDNQDKGSTVATVVDLLRITTSFVFECGITATSTSTAKQIKEQLLTLFHGANVESTPAILTYEDESIDVFFQDLIIKKVYNDNVAENGYSGDDSLEYLVTITLINGELVGTPS